MAEAAVTFLLEHVTQMVVEYGELISGAETEFVQLSDELRLLKAIVKDVLRPKKYNNLFKELDGQIKDFVYEVEDTIDTLLTTAIEAKSKKKYRMIFPKFNFAKKVKAIREEMLTPMLNDAKRKYDVVTLDESRSMEDHSRDTVERVAPPIRQGRIIGFDDEEETIIGYLIEPKNELDVIPIVGIPGQGKTALAWKVFQNEKIGLSFPIRIWISISQVFESRNVFLQILRKFVHSGDLSGVSNEELAKLVLSCLEKARFLLVLDDVCSVEAWNKIKEVLPMHNGNGKVLITSRETSVGMQSKPHRPPHQLKFLDDVESWSLLKYEVFDRNLEECPPELEDIGKDIASKCDGVPLTIVIIGGILLDQHYQFSTPNKAKQEWEKLPKFESHALQSDKSQRITDAIDLSYNRLPGHLRQCFLYLGVFPQDYEIPTKTLYRLWISEGFILPNSRRSLEESAEEILRELIYKNLLKVQKVNDMGEAKTCSVPKLIRAFCIAKSKEESLFQEVKRSNTGALEPPVSELQKSRRLCLHSDLSKFLSENPIIPHVRSFLCFCERPVELEPQYISAIPDAFPKLRVWESKYIKFDRFPPNLTKLIHLRYLTLYIGTLAFLPESIAQLWNLQALVVDTRSHSITMKANLWRMVRLRHLSTNATIVLEDDWVGEAGYNLQTLDRLSPESCTAVLCTKAKYLKTLGISGKLASIFETQLLGKFLHLEKLVNRVTYEETPEDMRPPNSFPPNLKRLTLTSTRLGWSHMSTLAMIRGLEVLKLKDNALVGVSWRTEAYVFPSLQLFLMAGSDLIVWETSDHSFPKLRFLVVKKCDNLKEIPECLGTYLEKLEIEHVRPSVVESAKKIAVTNKNRVQFNLKIANAYETN